MKKIQRMKKLLKEGYDQTLGYDQAHVLFNMYHHF